MIKVRHKGDFTKTTNFFKEIKKPINIKTLEKYGKEGVSALASATPIESGLTANSWYYEIEQTNGTIKINFSNSNIQNGVPIAIILQFGHGTGTGGWVEGKDYINPTIQPIFDKITNDAWKEVTKA